MNADQIFRANCPHCHTKAVGFTIQHIREWREYCTEFEYVEYEDALAVCGFCDKTVLAEFGGNDLLGIVPSPPEPPMYVPDNVKNFFQQGINNLSGDYDAAGAMFRKALETALKMKFPEIGDMKLKNRIDKIAKQGDLTPALAAWSHEIRDGGNDAAHEEDPFSEEDAQDLYDFTELVLLYLFTLPEKLRRAQERKERQKREREPDIPPPNDDDIPF